MLREDPRMARLAAAILAVAITGPAQLQARTPSFDPFCADLRRIVAAAEEDRPFASLPSGQDDVWMGGAAHCHRVTQPSVSFYCVLYTRSVPDGRPGLAARSQRCLSGAVIEIDDADSRSHHQRRLTRLRARRVLVDVAEQGGAGVHIGWYYSIDVYAVRRRELDD